MLDIAKEFRLVLNSLAIQDPSYTFNLPHEEWENAAMVCMLLKVFYEATNVISGTKYPTANLYLHEMLKVKLTLDQKTFEEESEMHSMPKYMKKKFDKYWKVSWLDLCPMSQGVDVEMGATDQDPLATWDQHVTDRAQLGAEYPTLSCMTRDILAVPASTVASESAFSTRLRVLSDFQSRMTLETVKVLVCLQDWIRASGNTQCSMDSIHDITMEGEDDLETSFHNLQ
ncbi:hypothetical protein U9M48_001203 [Paspalum notatum var. saurae]|uniref:HAT C-terminal dimerisation domain-containing protein n=1 Tax=Paspalum notatum var. saurae TaxID=547442 RepID=A0AAQ3PHT0_PASNO